MAVFMADLKKIPKIVAQHKNLIVWNDLLDPRFKGYDAISNAFQ